MGSPKLHKRLQAANMTQTRTWLRSTFVEHLHGSGAPSLHPQIYEAATELDDKIRYEAIPETDTFKIQPSPAGSPAGDPARDSAGDHRAVPRQHVQSDHVPEASLRTSRRSWTIAMQPIAPRKEEDQEHKDHD